MRGQGGLASLPEMTDEQYKVLAAAFDTKLGQLEEGAQTMFAELAASGATVADLKKLSKVCACSLVCCSLGLLGHRTPLSQLLC